MIQYLPIKAEVIINECSNKSMTDADIAIIGDFNKELKGEVEITTVIEENLAVKKFKVNKKAIADKLPKALIYGNYNGKKNVEIAIEKEYQNEKEARKYFAPLDNLLFMSKLKLEQIEFVSSDNLQKGYEHLFIAKLFGNRVKDLSEKQKSCLFFLYPQVSHIVGNIHYTSLAYSYLIGKEVNIEKIKSIEKIQNNDKTQSILGYDFILNSDTQKETTYYKINIVVEFTTLPYFLFDPAMIKYFNTIEDLIIPIDVKTLYSFDCDKTLLELGTENYLGYTIKL